MPGTFVPTPTATENSEPGCLSLLGHDDNDDNAGVVPSQSSNAQDVTSRSAFKPSDPAGPSRSTSALTNASPGQSSPYRGATIVHEGLTGRRERTQQSSYPSIAHRFESIYPALPTSVTSSHANIGTTGYPSPHIADPIQQSPPDFSGQTSEPLAYPRLPTTTSDFPNIGAPTPLPLPQSQTRSATSPLQRTSTAKQQPHRSDLAHNSSHFAPAPTGATYTTVTSTGGSTPSPRMRTMTDYPRIRREIQEARAREWRRREKERTSWWGLLFRLSDRLF